MSNIPLISIGIPTYNRPEGLRKTLESVTGQTYRNLQIIVSDNGSSLPEVETVLREFEGQDSRVIVYRQPTNVGPAENFKFVLRKAEGDFFIWAADDDTWQGKEFLNTLFKYAADHILTFPEAMIIGEFDQKKHLLESYQNCLTSGDYSRNFIKCGWGHPFYGLYNLKLFFHFNLKFEFDEDLLYHNEGTFLHKIFMTGPVKFVKDAQILFSTNSAKPRLEPRIDNFVNYLKRTILVYENSHLDTTEKSKLINLVLDVYLSYLRELLKNLGPSANMTDTSNEANGQKSRSVNIYKRLRRAARVLLKGK